MTQSRRADNVKRYQLKGSDVLLQWHHPGPLLRTKAECETTHTLCQAELSEWFVEEVEDADILFDDTTTGSLPVAWVRLSNLRKVCTMLAHRQLRGDGKGRLPWTSTRTMPCPRTMPGLQLATEIATDGAVIANSSR